MEHPFALAKFYATVRHRSGVPPVCNTSQVHVDAFPRIDKTIIASKKII